MALSLHQKKREAKKALKPEIDGDVSSITTPDTDYIKNAIMRNAKISLAAGLNSTTELAAEVAVASCRSKQALLDLAKAQREKEASEQKLKEAEATYQKLLSNGNATKLEQEESFLKLLYHQALVVSTSSNYELQEFMRDLAGAKESIVNAEVMLYNASNLNNPSYQNEAQTNLTLAREEEEKNEALIEPAQNEAIARNLWCKALEQVIKKNDEAYDQREQLAVLAKKTLSLSEWDDLLQEAQEIDQAWSHVVTLCRSYAEPSSAQNSSTSRKIKKAWEKDFNEARNQQVLWQSHILEWQKAREAAYIAAQEKVDEELKKNMKMMQLEAEAIKSSVEAAYLKTGITNCHDAYWDAAMTKAQETVLAYDKYLEALQQTKSQVRGALSVQWDQYIESAKHQKNYWSFRPYWISAEQMDKNATLEKKRIENIKAGTEEADAAWGNLLGLAEGAARTWAETFHILTSLHHSIGEGQPFCWSKELQTAKEKKKYWAARLKEVREKKEITWGRDTFAFIQNAFSTLPSRASESDNRSESVEKNSFSSAKQSQSIGLNTWRESAANARTSTSEKAAQKAQNIKHSWEAWGT